MYNQIIKKLFNNKTPISTIGHNTYGKKISIVTKPDRVKKDSINKLFFYSELCKLYESGRRKKIIKNIIVHGSYGDLTYTNYSDIELTIHISNDVFNGKATTFLNWVKSELNPFIVSVDPLQHHGAFYIWDDFIKNYDESVLPLCAYKNSWSLNEKTIKFLIDRNFKEHSETMRERLEITLKSFEDIKKSFFKHRMSNYSEKRMISNFCMIPIFLYQSKGLNIDKPQSIEKIKKELPIRVCGSFNLASEIRAHWPERNIYLGQIRKILVREKIPQGKLDSVLCSFPKNQVITQKIETKLIPEITKTCQYIKDHL